MDALHATTEEFVAEGYTHVECFCPRCRVIKLRPMSWLPKISMGLTLDQFARRPRNAAFLQSPCRLSNEGRPRLVARTWKTVKVTKMIAVGRNTRGRKAFRFCKSVFFSTKTHSDMQGSRQFRPKSSARSFGCAGIQRRFRFA